MNHNDRCASLLGQGCDCRPPWDHGRNAPESVRLTGGGEECGFCEGHGYTIKTVLGKPGVLVECSECDGTGSVLCVD